MYGPVRLNMHGSRLTREMQFCTGHGIDRAIHLRKDCPMAELIYPRSPREMMSGWAYLPRFVDKIRLHLAGRLHPDYQENFTQGFDAQWLKAAGLEAGPFIE